MTGYEVAKLSDPGSQVEPQSSIIDVLVKAMDGDPASQHLMGYFYEKRTDIAPDYDESAQWYSKSAQQGFTKAEAALGACYYNGRGVFLDYNEAIRWLRKASDKGDDNALLYLGECYASGKGVITDLPEAANYYKKSSEQGNPEAQYKLGECYIYGNGVEKDPMKAYAWLTLAVDQHHIHASISRNNMERDGLSTEIIENAKVLARALGEQIKARKPQS